ncbi:MAG: hydroxymethylglutaryl-CoA lyase [bacterium]|nr:hydroxymethylglutaryl-CoA lyase [bacterium]
MGQDTEKRAPEVKICDVTLRDGMQVLNRNALIPVRMRLRLAETLQRAHIPYIEAGSFVNPRIVSAMQDTTELFAQLRPAKGQQLAALVPKLKYYQQMKLTPHVDTVALFISASETYSLANTRMTPAEAVKNAREVATAAREDGYRVRAYLSYAFREMLIAPGEMPTDTVELLCEHLLEMGCETIALSDTDGRSTGRDVERMINHVDRTLGLDHMGVHLHDLHGLGLVNSLIAYQLGIRTFDCSIGGLGGNKIVENSIGNVATEELVNMFNGMGVATGIDFDFLLRAGRVVIDMAHFVGDPAPPSRILADQLLGVDQTLRKIDVG